MASHVMQSHISDTQPIAAATTPIAIAIEDAKPGKARASSELKQSAEINVNIKMQNKFTKLFTIGYEHKTEFDFITLLQKADVRRVIDIRCKPNAMVAGFAVAAQLRSLLKEQLNVDYLHLPLLTPTPEMLDGVLNGYGSWQEYSFAFLQLMNKRQIETALDRSLFEDACLLDCEDSSQFCHRSLVARYLNEKWGNIEIVHLTLPAKIGLGLHVQATDSPCGSKSTTESALRSRAKRRGLKLEKSPRRLKKWPGSEGYRILHEFSKRTVLTGCYNSFGASLAECAAFIDHYLECEKTIVPQQLKSITKHN